MAVVGISALIYRATPPQGHPAPRRRPGARPRPRLLRALLRRRPRAGLGRARRGADLHVPSASSSPTVSTSVVPCAAAATSRTSTRLQPLLLDCDPRRRARQRSDRDPVPGRARGDGRRRAPVRRGAHYRFRAARHRAAGALPDPGTARHRAAGEGEQLLLGPPGQGQPGVGKHHRGDGLPVDDPDRLRPRIRGVGPRPLRRRCRPRSASPAAESPTGRCGCAGASSRWRSSSGARCSRPSSSTSWSPEARTTPARSSRPARCRRLGRGSRR